tara:strand:- start:1680 stop:2192 length:513 start_codon:yes stop_codon:yes gene_type:complete
MADENENTTPEGESPESTPEATTPDTSAPADDAGAQGESQDEAEMLESAVSAVGQVQDVADSIDGGSGKDATPFEAPVFSDSESGAPKEGMDLLSDVHMNVRIELGRTKMYVEDVLKLNDGAVVELDKLAGDPVDVFVNDRKVARGEVLVLNDMFCVRVSEIVDISAASD